MKKKIIHGIKGSISIFLIILMLPFLEIAGILVEANRYNGCMSVFDEILGSSAFSTLADNDSYLKKRFGLLAFDQTDDISTVYNKYLSSNLTALPGSITVGNNGLATVAGKFPLSDEDVLRQQILEYSKLNVPAKILSDFGDLSSIIGLFKGLESIENIFDGVQKAANVLDKFLEMMKKVNELKTACVKLQAIDGSIPKYGANYNNFKNKINAYNIAVDNYNTKKNEYDIAVSENSDALSDLTEKQNNVNTISQQLSEINQEEDMDLYVAVSNSYEEAVRELEEAERTSGEAGRAVSSANRAMNSAYTNMQNKYSEISGAKSEYSSAISTLIDDMSDYQRKLDAIKDSIEAAEESIPEGAEGLLMISHEEKNKELERAKSALDEDKRKIYNYGSDDSISYQQYLDATQKYAADNKAVSDLEKTIGSIDEQEKMLDSMKNYVDTSVDKGNQTFSQAVVQKAQTNIDKLRVTKQNVDSFSVSLTYKVSIDEATYFNPTMSTLKDETLTHYQVQAYVDDVKEQLDKQQDFWSFINGIKDVIDSLFKTKLFNDENLNAKVNGQYFTDNYGLTINGSGNRNALTRVVDGLTKMLSDISRLISLNCDIWDKLDAILDFIVDSITFIGDLFNFVKTLLVNIYKLISGLASGGASIRDSIYLKAFFTYMLPCRTDYASGKNLCSTYSFGAIDFPERAETNFDSLTDAVGLSAFIQLFDSLKNLKNDDGTDLCFRGAELEYLFAGTTSETINQFEVFFSLYLMRLMLDAVPVVKSPQVQSIAGASTFGYGAVIAMFVILEPMIDTYLLVNGSEVKFWKTEKDLFMTPTGIPSLLPKILSLTPQEKERMGNKFLDACGTDMTVDPDAVKKVQEASKEVSNSASKSYLKGLMEFDYKQYLFLMMLVFSDFDAKNELKLFKNIVQMESMLGNSTFDIRKSFTTVNASAEAKINPFFPGMIDFSLFKRTRKIMRGY